MVGRYRWLVPSSPTALPHAAEEQPRVGTWQLLAAVLVAVQGSVVLAFAVYYVIGAPRAFSTFNVLASAAMFVLAGAGLLWVARGLQHGRRWARAPALTWQILCLPVAYGLMQSGRWYIGVPLAVSCLLIMRGLFSNRS